MRELGFSQLWPKLAKPRCTTFRFARRDKDWYVGETVKVLYKARSHKDRSVLGLAVIVERVPRWVAPHLTQTDIRHVSVAEAKADGFADLETMRDYMFKAYWTRYWSEPMNKLTLAWTQYWLWVPEQKEHVQKEWATLMGKLFTEVLNYTKLPKGESYILHQSELERIHNQAALGSMTL